MINDKLETVEQVKEYFMSRGFKMIPLGPRTKAPVKGFSYDMLEETDYDFPLDGDENIGMGHGPVSGTYAIDVDFKEKSHTVEEAIKVLFNDIKKALSSTLVIKTPKQGVHFIFKAKDGVYPEQKKYSSTQYPGVEIDIRSHHGLTVFPPSVHPEKQYGKYSFISDILDPAELAWENTAMILAERGFFTNEEMNDDSLKSDYNISKLLTGKFEVGSRRKSENSLYIKLRIRGKSPDEAKQVIIEVNRKCVKPLDEKEVDYNCRYAEKYYSNVVQSSLEEKKTRKNERKGFDAYDAASKLMKEYDFISHVSGEIYYYTEGIYRRNGKLLIAKKCRMYWEHIGIDTTMINEIINIIKDKTMYLSDDENQEIFDRDYKKIILKNGMYDIAENQFTEFDPNVKSTIKHPIFYDATKQCPNFDKFLESCFDGDEKRITQVLEMMALCFIKKYIIQKGYVNYGIGSNGKSTFLNILRRLIGIKNTTSIPMQQFQNSQFIGFELRGKCVNISADGGTDPIKKTGFIKGVLGGDAIRCEQKFRDPFDYNPFVTMIFTFNELPQVTDSSDGFARKIQTIHWDQRFYGDKRNNDVDGIAFDSDEKSGIFNKLIPIIKRLIDTKTLSHESTVKETKEVWLSRSDSFFKFKNDMIIQSLDYKITTDDIAESYDEFCREHGMTPINKNLFFSKLKELCGSEPKKTRSGDKQVRMWFGITLRPKLVVEGQTTL